ncbi:MAG: low molecular weight protein-tyrosine-phosphatase [Kofleriaceae bacterium]
MIHSPASPRIVFVCLGNICRSPTAEGVMRQLLQAAGRTDVTVASAGTGRWHVGEPPDRRTVATARRRGIVLDSVGRQFVRADFARFDLILAIDRPVARALRELAPDDDARARIRLLRSYDPAAPADAEVPDPYYGDQAAFDQVFDLCEAACRGLLASLPAPG